MTSQEAKAEYERLSLLWWGETNVEDPWLTKEQKREASKKRKARQAMFDALRVRVLEALGWEPEKPGDYRDRYIACTHELIDSLARKEGVTQEPCRP